MKKFLAVAVVLSFALVACDAFKDNYGNEPAAAGPVIPGVPNVGEVPATGALPDFASDTTPCEAVKEIMVKKSEGDPVVSTTVLSVAEEGAEISSKAQKLGTFTTKLSIVAGEEELLSLILKQTGEKDFSVCGVTYKDLKVKSGEITIERFNDGADKDATKAVNAGAFNLIFAAAEAGGEVKTAVSAIKDLATDAVEEAVDEVVEGTYFAEGLSE